ncbi:hypothetical protein [Limnoglobus roseus]|nr:hypothetical protein [Limnoglobus roseus]
MYDTHLRLDWPWTVSLAGSAMGMIVAVAVLEVGLRFAGELWREQLQRWPTGKRVPPNPAVVFWWYTVVFAHLIGLGTFYTTLDGGLRWAAAKWVYLGYIVPGTALAVARWGQWSLVERLFLRWGWAPVLAVGVPVALPKLLAAGLIVDPWD